MGAPKQKWTPEEEAALKAGVVKHGVGKWRTILKDPEFSSVLYLRSNVDLKVWFYFDVSACLLCFIFICWSSLSLECLNFILIVGNLCWTIYIIKDAG